MAEISLHRLSPKTGSTHTHKRLGCGSGSGHGQTSTRGQKGQRSRSGDGKLVGFEGGQTPLLRRIPKRGFRNTAFRQEFQSVGLAAIERVFVNQKEIDVSALALHRLIRRSWPVKILGDASVTRPYVIKAHAFSKSAKEKLEKAGGKAEVVAIR